MKTSTAKSKGRETENIFVEYLIEKGIKNAERRRLLGAFDQGDVTGWPDVVVEVKSGAKLDLPGWLAELQVEIKNAEAKTGFVAVRPKGKPQAKDWYAIMPMELFMQLMEDAGWVQS